MDRNNFTRLEYCSSYNTKEVKKKLRKMDTKIMTYLAILYDASEYYISL